MKVNFAFRSIRHKLSLIVLLTTLCALLVAGGALLIYDVRSYRSSWVNDLSTQAELLGRMAAAPLQFDVPQDARDNLKLLQFRPKVAAAAIYNARGALFATYARSSGERSFPKLPEAQEVKFEGHSVVIFKRIVENGEILGTVYLRADYELREKILEFLGILGAVMLGSLIVAGVIFIWLQSVITRPILSIAGIARNLVAERTFSRRAEKMSDDEVGVLADAFNDMLDEIEHRTKALEELNRELAKESTELQRVRDEVMRLNAELEQRVAERTAQLEVTNQELETFCYSVSHDLRAPLRSINGFSQALSEELPADMPETAQQYFQKIRAATLRMGQLIDDLLNLSRVSRGELQYVEVNLSDLAQTVIEGLRSAESDRNVDVSIWEKMVVNGDPRLLRVALENLLSNAWKFTSRTEKPRIEIGMMRDAGGTVYFVRDNGAGFDMTYVDKLFGAFQRLHSDTEYEGTGIGLATVQRIIHRHSGRIWVDAAPGKGAAFFFTIMPGNLTSGERAMS